jgi:hypothetical protein
MDMRVLLEEALRSVRQVGSTLLVAPVRRDLYEYLLGVLPGEGPRAVLGPEEPEARRPLRVV